VNARSTIWPEEAKRPANGNLVSKRPKGGLTPLLYAAREGALDAARVLAGAGADLNITEPDGINPLIMALVNAHYDLAALLLEAGANPNIADKWGCTALYAAIDMHSLQPSATRPAPKNVDKLNALDVARLALKRGATPNAQLAEAIPGRSLSDDPDPVLRAGATPFIRASKTGDVAAMRLLLEYGADPKIATKEGATALMVAAGIGRVPNESFATESSTLDAVKLALELGGDVNAADDIGDTALHGAAHIRSAAVVRFLVDHGAKVNVKNRRGLTPLMIADGAGNSDNPGIGSGGDAGELLRQLASKQQ